MPEPTKFLLHEDDIPTHWYNIAPRPARRRSAAAASRGTGQPIGPADLAPLFPMEIIGQEVDARSAGSPIPDEVRDVYRLWRPTPLYRAHRLEQALGTPARIFYKYEGVSPGRLAQAQHRRPAGLLQPQAGVKRLATETGAGQWGSSLAFACACSASSSRSTWSRSATTRSPIGGR